MAFDGVWHAGFLCRVLLNFQLSFGRISSFSVMDNLKWYWMGSLQEYPVETTVRQSTILCATPFLLYIIILADVSVCNITICADDTTLNSKCKQVFYFLQKLELASEVKSCFWWGFIGCGRKWFKDFKAVKTYICFVWFENGWFFWCKKASFQMLGLLFPSKCNKGS